MNKKTLILLVFVGLVSLPSIAQFQQDDVSLSSFVQANIRNTSMGQASFKTNAAFYESVLGSPYIYDALLPAKVNNFKDVVAARYDAYKDLVTIQISKTKNFYLEKKLGNKVTFINTDDEYRVFYDEKEKASFFKIIKIADQFSLLLKQKVKLTGGEKPKSTYDEYKAPAFKRAKDQFYLSLDSTNAVKIPTKKKKFYKLFSGSESKIKSFVKKNKINIKDQKDILKVLNYYVSL